MILGSAAPKVRPTAGSLACNPSALETYVPAPAAMNGSETPAGGVVPVGPSFSGNHA